jgi:hypothetical protein
MLKIIGKAPLILLSIPPFQNSFPLLLPTPKLSLILQLVTLQVVKVGSSSIELVVFKLALIFVSVSPIISAIALELPIIESSLISQAFGLKIKVVSSEAKRSVIPER